MNASPRTALSTPLIALVLFASPAQAQPTTTIDELGFMTGHWTRTTGSTRSEA